MATVGQSLTAPEAGWKRIGAFDSIFSYSGNWQTVTSPLYYEGKQKGGNLNAKISFIFTGTKLRIITDANTDHSSNIKITIDGQSDNFSICSSACHQRLSYEKTGLSAQVHTVELVNLENKGFGFSGIDVDDIKSPSNLIAAAGDSQVTLSWTAVDGATSYNVKRSKTAVGPYTTIASNVSGTSYVDTSVTNGTTYYYVVTAVTANGESANSNEASATPVATVVAPTGNALLRVTMLDSSERDYQLATNEIDGFINWFNSHTSANTTSYMLNKKVGTQNSKEYLSFDKIISFEVMELK